MKNALGRIVSGISGAFEVNEAFLSGALDVVVIRHSDGKLHASPFHVRFGKLKLLRSREKNVKIYINGVQTDIAMRLGKAGEAYFIEKDSDEDTENNSSPINSPDHSPDKSPLIDMSSEEDPVSPKAGNYRWYAPWRSKPDQEIKPKKGIFGSFFKIFNRQPNLETKVEEGLALSLCLDQIISEENLEKVFSENQVSLQQFSADPWKILNHPSLLLRINGKYLNWEKAAPILVSMIAFKSIANDVEHQEEKLIKTENPSKEEKVEEKKEEEKRPNNIKLGTRRSLILNSDCLEKLGLKEGANDVIYEVNSRLQGLQQIHSKIFLWNWNARVVISDVDGTITKSDVLGQIFPMVGKDWTHAGIAKFYSDITKNGYKVLYLTSRAIGQTKTTKEFLQSVNQFNNSLPEGPLITSPDRLFKSFVREVIHRTPQKFKAEKLREIAALFPEERNPFYAGFGNRDTDAVAYRAAGVPLNKIFIINAESRIYAYNNTYSKSYTQLDELVFEMFPPIDKEQELADYEFGSLNYWKTDYLPLLDDDLEGFSLS